MNSAPNKVYFSSNVRFCYFFFSALGDWLCERKKKCNQQFVCGVFLEKVGFCLFSQIEGNNHEDDEKILSLRKHFKECIVVSKKNKF